MRGLILTLGSLHGVSTEEFCKTKSKKWGEYDLYLRVRWGYSNSLFSGFEAYTIGWFTLAIF